VTYETREDMYTNSTGEKQQRTLVSDQLHACRCYSVYTFSSQTVTVNILHTNITTRQPLTSLSQYQHGWLMSLCDKQSAAAARNKDVCNSHNESLPTDTQLYTAVHCTASAVVVLRTHQHSYHHSSRTTAEQTISAADSISNWH